MRSRARAGLLTLAMPAIVGDPPGAANSLPLVTLTATPYTQPQVDNDFSIDIADITHTIRTHDVVTIRFVAVGQRLLLDFRSNELDGPLVRIVDPVNSIEARYAALKKMRPRFETPEKIVAVWWPRFVSSLESTGIWPEVMQRVADSGHPDAVRAAQETFRTLLSLERQLQRDAILGEGFRTLWSAPHSRA